MRRIGRQWILVAAAVAVVGMALLSYSWGQAQPPTTTVVAQPTKIAVVDVVKVFDNYQRIRDFDTDTRRLTTDIQAKDEVLAKKAESLEKQLNDLSPSSKAAEGLLEQLMQLNIERQTQMKLHEAKTTRDRYRLSEDVYQEILKAATALANERGFDMVLCNDAFTAGAKVDVYRQIERKKVLFVRDNMDLTDEILARLNKAYNPASPR